MFMRRQGRTRGAYGKGRRHGARRSCGLVFVGWLLLWGLAGHALAQPGAPSLRQQVVFVIDNSGSMNGSDPLKLRGVAASLILDALELTGDVEVGLVLFNDRVAADGQWHSPDEVRRQLQGDKLPPPLGGTKMEAALERAINLFGGSNAPSKRVILLTDGRPTDGSSDSAKQVKTILETLVPQAQQAGIVIDALGLSKEVDEVFLQQVAGPTGGLVQVSENHDQLLEKAKQLVGQADNVVTLDRSKIQGTTLEVPIEIPAGIARVRITAIFNSPNTFARDELEIELHGPDPGDGGRTYLVNFEGVNRVAAWTTFVSTAGTYTLQLRVSKPGFVGDHQGLRLFVEGLSVLELSLELRPVAQPRRLFGDEVQVKVAAAKGNSPIDPAAVTVTGVVQSPDGATQPIDFNGLVGTFRVPEVSGRHTVKVTVQTAEKLVRRNATVSYQAVKPESAQLVLSRENLVFTKALGPEDPVVEEFFDLSALFPDGVQPAPVQVRFQVSSPGVAYELLRSGGGPLRTGGRQSYGLSQEGMTLSLKLSLDPKRPLTQQQLGKLQGQVRVSSDSAITVVLPFSLDLRQPRFELVGAPEAVALWWDPMQKRAVSLGKLVSDLTVDSTFSVTLPSLLSTVDDGPTWVALGLSAEGHELEPASTEAGRSIYGPIDLPAGKPVSLKLSVKPVEVTDWRELVPQGRPLEVRLDSDLGMSEIVEPKMWNVGGQFWAVPFIGPLSSHGRLVLTWLVLLPGLVLTGLLAWRRLNLLRRFWRTRPGSMHYLPSGQLQVGEKGQVAVGGLTLPPSGSDLDGAVLAQVWVDPKGLRLADRSGGYLTINDRPISGSYALEVGDLIGVADPEEPEDPLWEFDYLDYLPESGGELQVHSCLTPVRWGSTVRKLAISIFALWTIRWLLGWSWVGAWASRLPLMEQFYLGFLQP